MRRTTALLAGALAALTLVAGCSGTIAASTPTPIQTHQRTAVTIASLKGPTTMGLVHLMADADAGTADQDYRVSVYGTPDEIVPLLVKGKVDVALVPANLAAVVYNQTRTAAGPAVQALTVNTLGVLQVVESGDTVHSLADLRGKTVYSTGKGASPEYVLDHLLVQSGLTPGSDVTIEYKSEATEVTAALAATPGAIGVLPQPYATAVQKQNPSVRTAIDLTDAWNTLNPGSQLVTGVTVVRTAFAEQHPAALADFLADYQASVAFTNDHPDQAGALIAKAGIVASPAVATAAIPASHVVFLTGDGLRSALQGYLQVLHDANPQSVGGSMPGDDFYRKP